MTYSALLTIAYAACIALAPGLLPDLFLRACLLFLLNAFLVDVLLESVVGQLLGLFKTLHHPRCHVLVSKLLH